MGQNKRGTWALATTSKSCAILCNVTVMRIFWELAGDPPPP